MKRTLIAAAVLSCMALGTAYADGSNLYTSTDTYTDVGQYGHVYTDGQVHVSSSAGAVVDNTQSASLDGAKLNPPPQSYTSGNVKTTYDAQDYSFNGSSTSSKSSAKTGSVNASFSENTAQATSSNESQGHNFSASGKSSANSSNSQAHSSYTDSHAGIDGSLTASGHGSYHLGNTSASGNLSVSLNGALNTHTTADSGSSNSNKAKSNFSTTQQEASSGYSNQASSQAANGALSAGYTVTSGSASQWNKTASVDQSLTTTTGSVTQHINTQVSTPLSASIDSGALQNAQGNIGVNVATGLDNAQSNDAALANIDVGPVFGNAQIYSTQTSSGSGKIGNFDLQASVGDNVLQGAQGNIGVNVTSGLGNVQNNSLAVSATTISSTNSNADGGQVVASDDNSQTASANIGGGFTGSAALGSGALSGAMGNIGVNIAAGGGNLQHNGLSIASVAH